jgi:hypothetical protein
MIVPPLCVSEQPSTNKIGCKLYLQRRMHVNKVNDGNRPKRPRFRKRLTNEMHQHSSVRVLLDHSPGLLPNSLAISYL